MAPESVGGTKIRLKILVNEVIDNLKLSLSFVDNTNKENNIVATVNNGLTYTQVDSKTYYLYEEYFDNLYTFIENDIPLLYVINRGNKFKEINNQLIMNENSSTSEVGNINGEGRYKYCLFEKEIDATNWTPNVINYSFGLTFTSNVEIPSLAINISAQYDTSTIISQLSTPTNGLTYNNGVYSMSFTGDNSTTLQQMEGTVPITVSISANKYKPFTESFIINNMADKPENGGLYIKQYSIDQLTPIKEYVNYLHMNGCVHYGNHLVRYGGIIS